jgi:hypothetical protein
MKGVILMKKILLNTIAMLFLVSVGITYGAVTDFRGLNYDIGVGPADVPATSMEGVHAGGMRDEGPGLVLYNSVTDFSGKTYEDSNLKIEPSAIEAAHAGGMREENPVEKFFKNGVTDFSGETYE